VRAGGRRRAQPNRPLSWRIKTIRAITAICLAKCLSARVICRERRERDAADVDRAAALSCFAPGANTSLIAPCRRHTTRCLFIFLSCLVFRCPASSPLSLFAAAAAVRQQIDMPVEKNRYSATSEGHSSRIIHPERGFVEQSHAVRYQKMFDIRYFCSTRERIICVVTKARERSMRSNSVATLSLFVHPPPPIARASPRSLLPGYAFLDMRRDAATPSGGGGGAEKCSECGRRRRKAQ